MKRLMILGGSMLQLPAIISAMDSGYYVIVVDIDENCIGFSHCSERLLCSTIDYNCISDYVSKHHIDGILTLCTDRPVNVVAKIAEENGLTGVSSTAAYNSTNKARMRMILRKNSIPVPNFSIVSSLEEFNDRLGKHQGDVIIKASDNSGKRGVTRLFNKESVEEKHNCFKYAMDNSMSKEVLIEDLITGLEFSVETVTWRGFTSIIAVTNKYNSGSPYYVEIGHSQPAKISYSKYLEIEHIVKKTINALEIDNTACHVEIMVSKKGVYVIEIGPRLGGDNISTTLVRLSSGIDMVKAAIDIALGYEPSLIRTCNYGAAIFYILPTEGVFAGVNNLKNILRRKDIESVEILKKEGYPMKLLSTSSDRIGYVICSGNTVGVAERRCKRAVKSLSVISKINQE